MKIAIASPPYPGSLKEGLAWVEKLVQEASSQGALIVCFPESYLPGYPGCGFVPEQVTEAELEAALQQVCSIAREYQIAVIIPMDRHDKQGLLNVSYVVSRNGEVLGYQTKNQLDPSEDEIWVPGDQRQMFEVDGLRFGITICHEGFRYPESVRWSARQGAHIVFHPHLAGSDSSGKMPKEWGSMDNPYYEKAMMMRALENTVYFASSNYATRFPESASAVIAPDGTCIAHAEYGEVGVIVVEIDLSLATGYLAKRFKSHLY
ncbi:MAG TPA: carbon-nitrogen hydrolase family protein [Chitinophagaceae bacterium]|nr:carbon-nitrogen hydrolase family protein [Chitinophagaceae bacterium]